MALPGNGDGFIGSPELIEILNELVAAERAGARVVSSSRCEGMDPFVDDFLKRLSHDEASCCAMLTRHVMRLGGTPTMEVGAFFASAMAVAGITERLIFVNRGQAWVVRRIEKLLPRLHDEGLKNELEAMLATHRANIQAAADILEPLAGGK